MKSQQHHASKPLRILQVVSSLTLGGAERIVARLAEQLRNRGDVVAVAYLATIEGNSLARELRELGFVPINLAAANLYDVRAVVRLVRLLRRERIDVMHTHLLYADVHGRIAGRAAGVPVISTLHTLSKSFERQRADRFFLERITARLLAARVVTVTAATRSQIVQNWGVPENRAVYIPNGIDLRPWLQVPESLDQGGRLRITTVGRLIQEKAHENFVRAARILLERGRDVTFRVVGGGEREAELKALARAEGVAEQIEFTGARSDVPNLLADSHIFVLSSDWEGMPLSAMEAQAAGRPAVVTDVGGMRHVVEDGVTGFIVPPGDPDALATALDTLIADPERRRAMGLRARAFARERLSDAAMVDRYRELYEEVLQDESRPQKRARDGVAGARP